MNQAALFEPTGAEIAPLAAMHARKAEAALRTFETFRTRGWDALAWEQAEVARQHYEEAECLAMLAEFERLGGVRS